MIPQQLVGLRNIQEECTWDKKKEVLVSASMLLEPSERSDFVSKNSFMGIVVGDKRGLRQQRSRDDGKLRFC